MRDALSLLDQLIAFGGGTLSEANTRSMLGTIDRGHVTRIVEALSRQDGPALLAQAAELDRDAPDYDRALVDLAALLQRVAIVQIVPDAALEDEEFDPQTLIRLSQAISAEDVQLYYQIALAGRRDLPMAPDPRLGFEMTLLRMLAFRPDSGAPAGRAVPAIAAAGAGGDAPRPQRAPAATPAAAPAGASAAPAATAASGPPVVDASTWPAVVEAAGLTGMVRQFALNCVPASLANGVLVLRLDEAVDGRRSRQVEEKLTQGLARYLGRDMRIVFEVTGGNLPTPARQRLAADRTRCRVQRPRSSRIRRSRACRSASARKWTPRR